MKAISPTYQPSSPSPNTSKCCTTGHPVMADPLTGRNTCSCQLTTGSVPSYLSRVPTLPESMYAGHGAAQLALIQRQILANSLYSQRPERQTLKAAPPSGHHPYHYDHLMGAHPYAAMYSGFDINGMKRKNATRESTSALKAWLFQHRKNPYPTKAEKVMLAIVSQMTLTQVSTWFANARRRLKKESKTGDGEFDIDDVDVDDKHSSSRLSDYDSDASISEKRSKQGSDVSDCSDAEDNATKSENPSSSCYQRLFSPDSRNELFLERISSPRDTGNDVKDIKNSACVQMKVPGRESVDAANEINHSGDKEDHVSTLDLISSIPKTSTSSLRSQDKGMHESKKIWSIAHIIG